MRANPNDVQINPEGGLTMHWIRVQETIAQGTMALAQMKQVELQALQSITVALHGSTCLRAHDSMMSWGAWFRSVVRIR